MRRTLLLGSVAVVAAAAVLVPLPLVELAPGPTFDVPPVVSLDGHAQRAPTGRLLAVTVLLTRPRATDLVGAWLRRRDLSNLELVGRQVQKRLHRSGHLSASRLLARR